MKNITLGILAHVDAGKTTLSEAILYSAGVIKECGRVDSKNTVLDNNYLERQRGITIFSKQAYFSSANTFFSLLDTPGHVDFSPEMERTLQVLDYVILVINGVSGVQAHTVTLWKLFKQYNIPVFVFVNKMDYSLKQKDEILLELKTKLGDGFIDFHNNQLNDEQYEEIIMQSASLNMENAISSDNILEEYMEKSFISNEKIAYLIKERCVFPCYFGSALKLVGVDDLLLGLDTYTEQTAYNKQFGAKVYKITRDSQGNRLTHLKITGGKLAVKDQISNEEKINEIRLYNGDKYTTVNDIDSGIICAVTGLSSTYAGQGLGVDFNNNIMLLEPILVYKLLIDGPYSTRQIFPNIKQLEEELPELSIEWIEAGEEIHVKLMGQVQIEVLRVLIKDRYGYDISFDMGSITYKETIENSVIGVGHFEPLRHYAETHLLLEPAERGSGIIIEYNCSEDILSKNWQRLIATHLNEKIHKGVLTGSPLTDVKITIINGRAHQKHTEGGDFRQATYRAVRNGLMKAKSVLLEPYYDFRIEVPIDMLGKIMTDLDKLAGKVDLPDMDGEMAILTGTCPVATLRDFQINFPAYTKGLGQIACTFSGYNKCHNQDEIVSKNNYDPDGDLNNPSSSVFCAHGAGFIVPWYQVEEYMHVFDENSTSDHNNIIGITKSSFDQTIDLEEIDEILSRTYNSNAKADRHTFKKKHKPEYESYKSTKTINKNGLKKILIVDGYNVIFAWEDLSALANTNIDAAKDKLIHILSNYKGCVESDIMVVFDAYKVKDNPGSHNIQENVQVVYTKEGETADLFIEQYTNSNRNNYDITVASSDGLIQQITHGQDCRVISSRELLNSINHKLQELREEYNL